jgi:small redox-active disulfide protein 2
MKDNEIKQIRVQNSLVGIIGLEAVMVAMAAGYAGRSDAEIGGEMIRRLEAKNYMPPKARPLYQEALAREFRKYVGQPVAEAPVAGMRVVILGPGCAQCDRMEVDVREVMAEMGLAAALDHITDLKEIGRYGVMGTPALIINDRVVCVGQAPNRKKIREWLEAANT